MTVEPLISAPLAVQMHVACAAIALPVGSFALFRPRRDRVHKVLGYIWVAAIVGLSLSGLLIESSIALIGAFGPIHLFSLFALWGVAEGLWHIRKGDIARHRAAMQSVWFGAMGTAGLLTLLPGRVMNRMLFPDTPEAGLWIVVAGLAMLLIGWRRWVGKGAGQPA